MIFLTSLFLFTRISKVHSLNMAKARTISHVVFDRNAFLPSLKLNPLTVLSGLVEVWSLSGEIVAVLETSATLWLPLLNENSNVRVLFDDLPLRRSFVPHDRQHTTSLAMVNVWTRSDSVLTILISHTYVLLARVSCTWLQPVFLVFLVCPASVVCCIKSFISFV